MSKRDLLIGFLIGIAATCLGTWLFLEFAVSGTFTQNLQQVKRSGYLGKVIAIGALLNMVIFLILLKINKDQIAKGVVFATISWTVITLLV
ncbi:hypothetical protein [Flavobacterium kingsejongi]|uniref:Uncharacterized protein n=1 Tax=Flavobacterium kingsejongi TaxID=1678728 RepID=A0A2S1LN25_9FLAO|nr:hypothetical protein [Flavobacterium kingsejongi]AWG25124.1 hypothetical protein FK004_07695 [Flavobacterium kingsejongi]